ncbi:MAG TPA: hypothetical protein VND93_34580 [Myxococcales bacterium]|jgi:hypothetical protein|nr:hypothetical protein [Myxococcales bacterium]
MRPVAIAAGAIAALLLAALPFRSSAGDNGAWGVGLDGGCRVRLDARPSTGLGCHVHFTEPDPDSGTYVEGIAAVACDATFEVCGETIRCHCPDW